MNLLKENVETTKQMVVKQLRNYWESFDEEIIEAAIPEALETMRKSFRGLPNRRFYLADQDQPVLSPVMSVQWMIFLYRLAHQIYLNGKNGTPEEADQVYYLNKIMHANDWFYAIDLPLHFLCEHPLGSVLGRAEYGDHLFVYQGTTVGGNWSKGVLSYPKLGDNVILYSNSTVLGKTKIGNNVIVSSGTCIINSEIPDNCIVFGQSPNLIIKEKSEKEIKKYTQHIWKWEV